MKNLHLPQTKAAPSHQCDFHPPDNHCTPTCASCIYILSRPVRPSGTVKWTMAWLTVWAFKRTSCWMNLQFCFCVFPRCDLMSHIPPTASACVCVCLGFNRKMDPCVVCVCVCCLSCVLLDTFSHVCGAPRTVYGGSGSGSELAPQDRRIQTVSEWKKSGTILAHVHLSENTVFPRKHIFTFTHCVFAYTFPIL